jgi:hypothetical protein
MNRTFAALKTDPAIGRSEAFRRAMLSLIVDRQTLGPHILRFGHRSWWWAKAGRRGNGTVRICWRGAIGRVEMPKRDMKPEARSDVGTVPESPRVGTLYTRHIL